MKQMLAQACVWNRSGHQRVMLDPDNAGMKTNINETTAAKDILNRAAEVLELTYFEWRLHEDTEQVSKRKAKRNRATAAMQRAARICGRTRCSAYA